MPGPLSVVTSIDRQSVPNICAIPDPPIYFDWCAFGLSNAPMLLVILLVAVSHVAAHGGRTVTSTAKRLKFAKRRSDDVKVSINLWRNTVWDNSLECHIKMRAS